MKISTYWTNNGCTTTDGYSISITTTISSFDEEEMNKIHDLLNEKIGTCTVGYLPTNLINEIKPCENCQEFNCGGCDFKVIINE